VEALNLFLVQSGPDHPTKSPLSIETTTELEIFVPDDSCCKSVIYDAWDGNSLLPRRVYIRVVQCDYSSSSLILVNA